MTNYTDYPFSVNGFNFVSRIAEHSEFNSAIAKLPEGEFNKMNINAVLELLAWDTPQTLENIEAQLERVNLGATHAWILLGENA